MITISLCMIVKNEEMHLERCLDSVADLMDEIVIVDTGSTDRTKEIAARYTDRIFDFVWEGDFSSARNFAFSKATKEYIYSADADEVLDHVNRERFRMLKEYCDPRIEIVQMYYKNQLQNNAIYNYDREYRPKLFKRLREFVWVEPIHEMVRTQPLVFESDIEIDHKPHGVHASRDLAYFENILGKGDGISERLWGLYARELYIAGSDENLETGLKFFQDRILIPGIDADAAADARCVIMKALRKKKLDVDFLSMGLECVAVSPCSEMCYELGLFFEDRGEYDTAIVWYYNSAFETESILNIHTGGDYPLMGLSRCYAKLERGETALDYERAAGEWIKANGFEGKNTEIPY